MDTVRETMNLGNLCGGKILEVADHTIDQVLKNICDPSTPAEQKREVIIKLKFEPAENRELGTVSFSCEAKLASVKPAKGNFFIARKAPLAKLAGNATAETVVTLVDDGITQMVSMKTGAHMEDTQAVKGLVKLAPWRTFRDVDQPASDFIFRVKKNGDVPQFALFEADGGAWKLEALDNIARKLSSGLTAATVVS